jgi:hypothetical protein
MKKLSIIIFLFAAQRSFCQNVSVGGTQPPTSTLHVQGSVATNAVSVTGGLTLNASHYTILVLSTSVLTLPEANTCNGRIYKIVTRGAGAAFSATGPGYYSFTSGASPVRNIPSTGSLTVQSIDGQWYQTD